MVDKLKQLNLIVRASLSLDKQKSLFNFRILEVKVDTYPLVQTHVLTSERVGHAFKHFVFGKKQNECQYCDPNPKPVNVGLE